MNKWIRTESSVLERMSRDFMEQLKSMTNLLIVGSGAHAHCYAGLASSLRGVQIRVLTLETDHAKQWSRVLATNNFFIQWLHNGTAFSGKPHVISNEASKVVPGSHLILLTVDSDRELDYFEAMAPYLESRVTICRFQDGCHGGIGWYFPLIASLGEKMRDVEILSFPQPLTCELLNFGTSAKVNSAQQKISGGSLPGRNSKHHIQLLESLFQQETKIIIKGHVMGEILSFSGPLVHTGLLYGLWSNWDRKPLQSQPFLYKEATQLGADTVSALCEETLQIRAKLEALRPGINLSQVVHKYEQYKMAPDDVIADKSSLLTVYRTHKMVRNVPTPMVETNDGFWPDFKHRYFTDDIPNSLVVLKGIAEILQVQTPVTDDVIEWAQRILGKEYVLEGSLSGKNLGETRCPQRVRINTLKAMLGQ